MKAVSIVIPPDKSISHRAVMLASISEGTTCIKNLLIAEDIKRTIEAFRAMGVSIFFERGPKGRVEKFSTREVYPERSRGARSNGISSVDIVIHGVGMAGLKKPTRQLYLGNSGTTMRILPGILAGQDFKVVLTGDKSLSARPMKRIAEPLEKMGAGINGRKIVLDSPKYSSSEVENPSTLLMTGNILARSNNIEIYPPIKIHGGKLKGIRYNSKIASAQVKSCILLAGLYANGITSVSEPEKSRDHTERMLGMFGCRVKGEAPNHSLRLGTGHGYKVSLKGPVKLKSPGAIEIPGDISSAAFFIVAGCILPDTKITIKNVGLNPTRAGILDILKKMGAKIDLFFERPCESNVRTESRSSRFGLRPHSNNKFFEPYGDIVVKSSKLKGVTMSPKEVAHAIDEIPVIMVAACFAKGRTIIKGIEELRVKETDRIRSMVTNLRKIGADIEVKGEGCRVKANKIHPRPSTLDLASDFIIINGGKLLHGARVSSFGDHRTAMSMLVSGLATKGKVIVTGLSCINKSFPNFENLLHKVE